jgi:mono/diheme cytochrome c family protein
MRQPYSRLRPWVLSIFASVIFASDSGCRPKLPPSKPLSELTPQEASGHAVFQSHCARCHYANSEDGLRGPGLQGLYKLKYLPSGAPANDDRVTSAILHGRGMMPSFANDLDEQQLNDLIAYLHTL